MTTHLEPSNAAVEAALPSSVTQGTAQDCPPNASEIHDLAAELASAIEDGGLSLMYQPIVDLRTYRVRALEALARWWVPDEGWRAPECWIRIAEEHGLIVPFGRWALSSVLEHIATMRSEGHDPVPVAVNLSPLQLDDPSFLGFLADEMTRRGAAASDLDLELTENHFRMSSDRLRGHCRLCAPSAAECISMTTGRATRRWSRCFGYRLTPSRSTASSCATSPATAPVLRSWTAP